MSVSERVNKYKENFMVDNIDEEYYIEKYCELQEQYDNTDKSMVKTRMDLLQMMERINPTKGLSSIGKVKDSRYLIIVKDTIMLKSIYDIFTSFLYGLIKFNKISKTNGFMTLKNGVTLNFSTMDTVPTKYEYTNHINLTGDEKFEEDILRPIILGINNK